MSFATAIKVPIALREATWILRGARVAEVVQCFSLLSRVWQA